MSHDDLQLNSQRASRPRLQRIHLLMREELHASDGRTEQRDLPGLTWRSSSYLGRGEGAPGELNMRRVGLQPGTAWK